jgi:hypothetical protein
MSSIGRSPNGLRKPANHFAAIHQNLELISNPLQGIDRTTSQHTRILIDRGRQHAEDPSAVSRMRADLDSAIPSITAVERRLSH